MPAFQSIRASGLRGWRGLAATALVVACGACSFLLDRSTTQCVTDADCTRLGFHPYCQSGVCVDSHLGPVPACVLGTPTTRTDFLNHCSTGFLPDPPAACETFDDCARLGLCGEDAGLPPLVAPPPAPAAPASDAGASSMPICDLVADAGNGVVYITGSSNFPNVLHQIAPIIILGAQANVKPGPTPVFLTSNSCTGVKSMFSPPDNVMHDPGGGKYAQYYDQNGNPSPCSLGPNGHAIDVGESDVYSTLCDPADVPGAGGVLETLGPIQAMAFVVPYQSTEFKISHEAAREVFGIGGNNNAASPWNNPSFYFVRNKNTGTQQMIGLQIGVPANAFWGVDQGSATAVHDDLVSCNGNLEEESHCIGIISVDVYDSDRQNVRALAYQETNQTCAYLPDSTATSFDKQNVRDGHYPIWGPLHFYTLGPQSDAAGQFLEYVKGLDQLKAVLDAFIAGSLVPSCAMAVQRTMGQELGPLTPLTAAQSCACYFELHTKTPDQLPTPGCSTCDADDDCPSTRRCSVLHYCEPFAGSP